MSTRPPTADEAALLDARGWGHHDHCWHHDAYDAGNEPFTTDEALRAARCEHQHEHVGRYEVFCAGCRATLRDLP